MAGADTAAYCVRVPGRFDQAMLTLRCSLPDNRIALRLAILLRRAVRMRLAYPKIDVKGLEDVVLRPYFQDANVVAASCHHRRRAWKLENRPHFDDASGYYSVIARSKLNIVLRRGALGAAAEGVCYSLASRRR